MTQRDGQTSLRCSGWRWAWSPVQIILLWLAFWLAWLSAFSWSSRSCPSTWSICLVNSPGRRGRACSCATAVTSISSRASRRPSFTWAAVEVLAHGQIDLSGLVTSTPSGPGTFRLAVTGGTGNYQDARGYATVVPGNTPAVTIHLTP
jgi:hypothetical protein